LKMPIEIVDFPIKHGGSFHSYVNVYQRVALKMSGFEWHFCWVCVFRLTSIFREIVST
jgi:hypothetical protein